MQGNAWDKVADSVEFTLDIDIERFGSLVPRSHSVLDFGCGYGRHTNLLSRTGFENVAGIDASEKMVARANRDYPHLNISLHDRPGLPFPDGAFDAIVLCAVFTCIPSEAERILVFNELCRVLNTDGVMHLSEFGRSPGWEYDMEGCFTSKFGVRMKHFELAEIRALSVSLHEISLEQKDVCAIGAAPAVGLSYFGRKL